MREIYPQVPALKLGGQKRPTAQTDAQALAFYKQDWEKGKPCIFQSNGAIERLDAAARGEIRDPAEGLRNRKNG